MKGTSGDDECRACTIEIQEDLSDGDASGPPTALDLPPIEHVLDFVLPGRDELLERLTEPIKIDPCGFLAGIGVTDANTVSTQCEVYESATISVPVCSSLGCYSVQQDVHFAKPLTPPSSRSNIGENRASGLAVESRLRQLLGAIPKFFANGRHVDAWIQESRTAVEIKSGYTTLTKRIMSQIAKDVENLATGEARKIVWGFARSPLTGRIGASRPLLEELASAGITATYYTI